MTAVCAWQLFVYGRVLAYSYRQLFVYGRVLA